MRNGEMLKVMTETARKALRETNCDFSQAGKILGMTGNGVAYFAKRHKIVRPGRKLGEKKWVLA